jgi:hypothetical protein
MVRYITVHIDDISYVSEPADSIDVSIQPSNIVYPNKSEFSFELTTAGASADVTLELYYDLEPLYTYDDILMCTIPLGYLESGTHDISVDIPYLGDILKWKIYTPLTSVYTNAFSVTNNYIINPDFEDVTPYGWQLESAGLVGDHDDIFEIVNDNYHNGSSCLKLVVGTLTFAPGLATVFQDVDLTNIDEITFWYKIPVYTKGGMVTLGLYSSLVRGEDIHYYTMAEELVSSYTQYTIDTSELTDVYRFTIYGYCDSNLNSGIDPTMTVYLDDCVVAHPTINLENFVYHNSPTELVYTDTGLLEDDHKRLFDTFTDVGYCTVFSSNFNDGIHTVIRLTTYMHSRISRSR